MGILNNDTQTVDAVLTKVGKRRLAEGQGLNINSFALSDDYASYFLWNSNHVSGSSQYGEAVENLPLPEAVTSAGNALRFHLTTRDRNIIFNPIINIPGITFDNQVLRIEGHGKEHAVTVSPSLVNGPASSQYVFKLPDTTGLKFSGATMKSLSPTIHASPKSMDQQKPAEFRGKSLTIMADPTETAFEVLITVTEENSGATETNFRLLVDQNIYQKPSGRIAK
mgnify:CR=1 FL=1